MNDDPRKEGWKCLDCFDKWQDWWSAHDHSEKRFHTIRRDRPVRAGEKRFSGDGVELKSPAKRII